MNEHDLSTEREVDPNAPQSTGGLLVVPSRKISASVGLVAGSLAVTTGMVVAALGNVASPIDAVGSSFIDRTPRWLKELAIDWFGTNRDRIDSRFIDRWCFQ